MEAKKSLKSISKVVAMDNHRLVVKNICTVMVLFGLCLSCLEPAFAQDKPKPDKPKIKIGGFVQTTAIKTENNDAFVFGFDRVRISAKGKLNKYANFKLQVDFNKLGVKDFNAENTDKDGDSPRVIKDAQIDFKTGKKVKISVGKFKTPIGMEFNGSGTKLDFVKRGLGQAFVFERNVGAMVHAKKLGEAGLGFAFGVFNAGPSGATNVGSAAEGQDYTIAGRVSVDPNKKIHAQAFFGNALTSVDGQDAVTIFGLAAKVKVEKITAKAEFMSRSDKQSTKADGTNFYIQGGFLATPMIEPVIKYEKLDVENDNKDQGNLTLGVNIFLNPDVHNQARIQLNYVISDLDGKDAIQLMFQGAF